MNGVDADFSGAGLSRHGPHHVYDGVVAGDARLCIGTATDAGYRGGHDYTARFLHVRQYIFVFGSQLHVLYIKGNYLTTCFFWLVSNGHNYPLYGITVKKTSQRCGLTLPGVSFLF